MTSWLEIKVCERDCRMQAHVIRHVERGDLHRISRSYAAGRIVVERAGRGVIGEAVTGGREGPVRIGREHAGGQVAGRHTVIGAEVEAGILEVEVVGAVLEVENGRQPTCGVDKVSVVATITLQSGVAAGECEL